MAKFGPIKRKDLIRYFKKLGFSGPYPAENTNLWQKEISLSDYPILITQILEKNFY